VKLRYGVGAVAIFAAALAACSSGGSSGGYTPGGPTPIPKPATASTSAPLSTTGTTPVSLPAISNGSSATITLPAVSGNATASVTLQDTLPTGATHPQVVRRNPDDIGGGLVTPLDYILISVSAPVSLTSTPGFSFTFESAPQTTTYIAEMDTSNASAGWNVVAGPGTVSGNTVSFASQVVAPPLTLEPGHTYVFAIVATTSPVTPAPPTIAPSTAASYTGSKTVSYAYGYDFDYPNPGPTATAPPTTLNYNVSENLSVGNSKFPGTSTAQLVDEHIAETDSANVSTSSYTTDSWVSLASTNNSYNELLYGQTVQEPSSANLPVLTTLYNTPQIVDELPETNGASWSNNPQSTVSYSYASGDAGTRTVANDGTYTDVEQMGPSSGGGTVTMTENADGSGSITGPYYGDGFIQSIAFSAPSPAPSATPMLNVTLTYSTFAQQCCGYPATQTIPDYVWYPYTSGQPLTFYNETDSIKGNAALPASCKSSPYSQVTDVKRTIKTLDTVVGDMDTTTMDSYDFQGFPVCLVTNDVLSYAYNEEGTTPYTIYIGTQLGLMTVTTNESLVIQNTPATSSTSSARVRTQEVAQAHAFVAALQGHVLTSLARDRAAHIRSFIQALKQSRSVRSATVHGGHR